MEIDIQGRLASVKVDGIEHHNAITAYVITHAAGERPSIVTLHTVDEIWFDYGVWRDIADVRISTQTTDLLVALGWTPPPGQETTTTEPKIPGEPR